MKIRMMVCVSLGLGLVCSAQENGAWRAASKTAKSITGDLTIGGEKMLINFAPFTIAQIRALKPDEIGAAFDADTSAGGMGSLYRVNIPAGKKFLHNNTLCGSDDTQWMATYVAGHTLQVDFFSGEKPPVFTIDAISNSTDLCGTYMYAR